MRKMSFYGSKYPAITESAYLLPSIDELLLPSINLLSFVIKTAPADNGLEICSFPKVAVNSGFRVPTNSL